MSQTSPKLQLPYLQPSQAQKHVTHNEALQQLDILVQLRLEAIGAQVPPATAAEGDAYALGTGASGAWAGEDGTIAVWQGGGWFFVTPQPGWRAWDAETRKLYVREADGWSAVQADLETVDRLGIATDADDLNRLAVAAPASLLSHSGAGHQLKINKAATAETASLLFQSDWTGHAEMGLGGQDDFSIKVSADGSEWVEALRLDAASGHASGDAVQAGSLDATEGRLMKVGAFGLGETAAAPSLPDVDAVDTPAGIYAYRPDTSGSASLPSQLEGSFGIIRIERHNAGLLRQTAWRNNFVHGIWTRVHFAGAWQDWCQSYDQATILGPVSQSAGKPTGAVFERGAIGAGEYVRMADGTQICTMFFDTAADTHSWSFPQAFASAATVSIHGTARHVGAPRIVTEAGDLSSDGVTLKVWDTNGNPAGAPVHATAFGRWF